VKALGPAPAGPGAALADEDADGDLLWTRGEPWSLAAFASRARQQAQIGDDEGHEVIEDRLHQRCRGSVAASYHIGLVDGREDRSNHRGDRECAAQVLRLEDDAKCIAHELIVLLYDAFGKRSALEPREIA
jgi:hypothetical protein